MRYESLWDVILHRKLDLIYKYVYHFANLIVMLVVVYIVAARVCPCIVPNGIQIVSVLIKSFIQFR